MAVNFRARSCYKFGVVSAITFPPPPFHFHSASSLILTLAGRLDSLFSHFFFSVLLSDLWTGSNMHGCIRLNIIRGLTIISLVLVIATSFIVVIFNFKDGPVSDTFFSSVNHLVLIASTFVLIASELRLFEKRFTRYLPLLGPDSSLFTLGLTQVPSPRC
jgi:hypothetical protein